MPVFANYDPRTRALLLRTELGLELKQAEESKLWKFLLVKAEEEAAKAVDTFLETDPADVVAVQKVQNDIRRHREMPIWLKRAISDGEQADREIIQSGVLDGAPET